MNVSVYLHNDCLEAIDVTKCRENFYYLNNQMYDFPDSDRLYLEDANGFRYKRIFPKKAVKGLFYFKQI